MATIKEIVETSQSVSEIRNKMAQKKRPFSVSFGEVMAQYDETKHKVMQERYRRSKTVKISTGEIDKNTGKEIMRTEIVDVCRVCVPMQKTIVERSVGMLLSIPVEYRTEGTGKNADNITEGVKNILADNKINFFDKKLARALFTTREAAELWYFVPDENGKPTGEIRVKLLSPIFGDYLIPHFDEYDRMDALAREYDTQDEEGKQVHHFDLYTSENVYKYTVKNNDYQEAEPPQRHGFDRLPVVYYRQEDTEWGKVQRIIDRLETLKSNWGGTNDYFGAPSWFVQGKLQGYAQKGEEGRIYQGAEGADMRVLSWDNAPVSVQGEITALINDIYTFTQTPDISFETMKQLGSNTSGVALRLMFTDAHMKARVKEELFGEMFTRRYNILKSAYCTVKGYSEKEADEIRVTPIFTPFIPSNDTELINMLTAASQGPIMSQKTAVEKNPLVSNPDEELKTMEEQQDRQSQLNAFEPTI